MEINAPKFGVALAVSASILWLLCSALVVLCPNAMMGLSGNMMHMDIAPMGWDLSLHGVMLGLIGWAVFSGLLGWMVAAIYNKLLA